MSTGNRVDTRAANAGGTEITATRAGTGNLPEPTIGEAETSRPRVDTCGPAETSRPHVAACSLPADPELSRESSARGLPEVSVDGTEISPGVWVASATRADLGDPPAHAGDLAEAGTRPGWRRAEFLAGRHLLRHLLRRIRPDLAALPLCADPAGKPRLDAGGEDLALPGITISHDEDRIAAAVCAHGDVGVDVQLPPERLTDSAVRRCLGSHAPAVTALPRRRRAKEFAWVWTVQEACVKAAGTGMAGRPWSIDVPPGAVSGHWGGFAWLSLRTRSPVPLSCAFQPAP